LFCLSGGGGCYSRWAIVGGEGFFLGTAALRSRSQVGIPI
jgi:hypothetical protein